MTSYGLNLKDNWDRYSPFLIEKNNWRVLDMFPKTLDVLKCLIARDRGTNTSAEQWMVMHDGQARPPRNKWICEGQRKMMCEVKRLVGLYRLINLFWCGASGFARSCTFVAAVSSSGDAGDEMCCWRVRKYEAHQSKWTIFLLLLP